jgi:hypothetical protein
MVELTPLKSTNLEGYHYDAKTKVLTLGFKGGARHTYADVPPLKVDALASAVSPGTYFHAFIRNAHESQPVPPEKEEGADD